MTDTLAYLLTGLVVLAVALHLVALLRKPRFDTPADLDARLRLLEQSIQALLQSTSRAEGQTDRIARELDAFTQASAAGFEANKRALDEKLQDTVEEGRSGRQELAASFRAFEDKVEQRLVALDTSLKGSFEALQTSLNARLEALAQSNRAVLDSLKQDVSAQLGAMSHALRNQLEGNGAQLRDQVIALQESVVQQLRTVVQGAGQNAEQLRTTLNERLQAIQADNTAKLEEMRLTVDEKLHATLEQRLGDSFKLVSERLEQVHAGLGEMKTLAGSVGDLKRVMTNVRARGTWGEMQLGAIIESLLTAEQFARNVKTVPGGSEIVEFAIRMPGRTDDTPVWLPIDSKYPVEDYQRLVDAHETLDKAVIQQASAAFEASIRNEAKKIATKYLSPPHTTDFAILFVPTEGLFAEVLRLPGLVEALQTQHRVVVAGPTTLAAMLNSLRLGFRTLAIEKRSSEVWGILASVKTEFRKFGEIVDSTKKSIDQAANKFTELGRRTRAIERGLRDVHDLPAPASPLAIADEAFLAPDDDGDEPAPP